MMPFRLVSLRLAFHMYATQPANERNYKIIFRTRRPINLLLRAGLCAGFIVVYYFLWPIEEVFLLIDAEYWFLRNSNTCFAYSLILRCGEASVWRNPFLSLLALTRDVGVQGPALIGLVCAVLACEVVKSGAGKLTAIEAVIWLFIVVYVIEKLVPMN